MNASDEAGILPHHKHASSVAMRAVSSLKPHPTNPRTHSRRQIRQIADSIREFGFTNPVLVDEDNRVIAGHGRLEAAKLLGMSDVPTLCLNRLTEAQKRAYILADNRLAEKAGWDDELIALELHYIVDLDAEYDLTLTGFDTPEIDAFLGPAHGEDGDDEPVPEPDPEVPPVSRPGDLWELGDHRLFCGDAREADAFEGLLGRRRAHLVITDPPYNVPIDGHAVGLGRVKHKDFAMACGEMNEAEYTAFLVTVLTNLAQYSRDGSIHFLFQDWRHVYELLSAARDVYTEQKNLVVWRKNSGGMGTFYRSQHELIFVFKNGTAPHVNNFELGQHGRYRTNVWDFAGANSFGATRMDDLQDHPTVKPVALLADAILDCSKRGGIVLDCFGGSGSTIVAAERVGRRAYVMELEPRYVDLAIRRWEARTGGKAVHGTTGRSFEDMRDQREARAHQETAS